MKNSVVQYEEVKALNPITKKVETVRIEKPVEKTPEEVSENIKAQLSVMDLEPVKQVEVEDPLTGEKRLITLDRTGYGENKLIVALADPNLSRDQKDFALSMYLFERGKENTSMVVDLMRYKGVHTKETRVFKAQLRYDFQAFVDTFTQYLSDQTLILATILGVDIAKEREAFLRFYKEKIEREREAAKKDEKDYERPIVTYADFYIEKNGLKIPLNTEEKIYCAQVALAMHAMDEADVLKAKVRLMAEARERDKGKGIYMDSKGKPFTQDDPDLEEALRRDREITAEAKKDE